ncbi:MAG: FHA domain-containing protein [Mojavia pulchra JT2-VF2]|jgi:methylglyoxal synthase|uniref:FHA domain-containing protein n=1 Tax=Mojavia pulchra JT2-VF2 TaxID=287848 RepID=A0A951Q4R8_9NOST|nr:FHA domain-containing protein [Mojavia pulchra JT2-VF2]
MKVKVNYLPTLNEVNELDLTLATTPKGECMVGRSPDSDLVLDSPDVSRIHGKFFVQSRNYYFCDLGSRNGSIINGKLVEKNIPVILKDKDVIRIGDYVLTVEEITSLAAELPETVFRVIDPSLFSGKRTTENVNNINVVNQTPEVFNQIPEQFSQTKDEVETPEVVNVVSPNLEEAINALEDSIQNLQTTSEVVEEDSFVQPDDLISPSPEVMSVAPEAANEESIYLNTPVVEEYTFVQPNDLINPSPEVMSVAPEAANEESIYLNTPVAEEFSLVQPDDSISPSPEAANEESIYLNTPVVEEDTFVQPNDLISPSPEAMSTAPEAANEESIYLNTPVAEEFSLVQPDYLISPIPEAVSDEDIDLDSEIWQEFTTVQPRDMIGRSPAELSETPEAVSDEDIDLDLPVQQEFTIVQPRDIVSQLSEVTSQVPDEDIDLEILQDYTIVQARDVVNEVPAFVSNEVKADIAEVEAPEDASEVTLEDTNIELSDTVSQPTEVSEVVDLKITNVEIVEPVAEAASVSEIGNQTSVEFSQFLEETLIDLSTSDTEDISVIAGDLEALALEITAAELDAIYTPENTELEFLNVPEIAISAPESSGEVPELTSQTLEEVSETAQLSDIAEVTVSEPHPMLTQKNIVLIAHETKKTELAEFVNQHQEFFSQSHTVTWPSISEVLRQQTGITITQQIPAATSGGYQTINSLVNSGDILAVIFLRDFLVSQHGQPNEEALLRSCNINQVLLATNVPTAEAIIYYIQHALV